MRRFFADIGSAGGHRAMAKAVVPMRAFREKFGDLDGAGRSAQLPARARAAQFLHEHQPPEKTRSGRVEVRSRNRVSELSRVAIRRPTSLAVPERLIEVRDQIVGILEPDRQPQHPLA